ncbi:hypothetical protein OGH69_16190 [Flavobacterium sp. MFBS3-15]|uniref:hypothetical protein n=1 Tax=Flavobacterium sp. MFBS3-15 TaxID=2989816 RepID=UPI0022363D81|nr:hypothetical protein [Flavobacterium sp. MFBS3-15]MCW4470512.1 hypothetical protein [Flavobacterium sp. MFBS3-15]
MKKSFLFSVLLITSLNTFAQDKKSLEERTVLNYSYTASEQYEKLMDFTHPKIFTLVPREKMVEIMQRMTKGDGFVITIAPVAPRFNFGEIKKIDDASYSVITYDLAMKMRFTEPVADSELDFLLASFKTNLKTDDVTFDKRDNSFNIIKKSQSVAVWDKDSNGKWMFVNNSDGPIKTKLFSEKVIKELGI